MAGDDFYHQLAAFSDFKEIAGGRPFKPLPADWTVLVADIEGSTEAIERGRYKDVNTIGAMAIAAAQNAMGGRDFPFVFGGDGSSLVVPPEASARVAAALDGVRALARERFGMSLRVGAVGAAELYAEGARIEVAKFELCAGRAIAAFRGGGLSRAEEKIKGDPRRYAVAERPEHASDLSGLSCRWKPIPSEKGTMLSLLVAARGERAHAVYRAIFDRLESILNGDVASANPVHLSAMRYKTVWENLCDERRYHRSALAPSFFLRALGIVFAVLVFRWKLPGLVFDAKHYAAAISGHSDFRKFDDLLRMVVDCSPGQAAAIRSFLEELRGAGRACYGLHESSAALMTCFVYDTGDGGHIHFVDGGNGGYAMAAKQLKAQLKG